MITRTILLILVLQALLTFNWYYHPLKVRHRILYAESVRKRQEAIRQIEEVRAHYRCKIILEDTNKGLKITYLD